MGPQCIEPRLREIANEGIYIMHINNGPKDMICMYDRGPGSKAETWRTIKSCSETKYNLGAEGSLASSRQIHSMAGEKKKMVR
jgi:hypothetical protein